MFLMTKVCLSINLNCDYALKPVILLASTVSSKMLKRIGEIEGFHFEESLTGFKWLGNIALDKRKQGFTVPFAYEEAIGAYYLQLESQILCRIYGG